MASEDTSETIGNPEIEAVFRALPDLYFRLAADGTFLDYRAGRPEDLFLPPEQFLGKRLQDVLPEDAVRPIQRAISEIAASGQSAAAMYPLRLPTGEKTFEARLVPFARNQIIVVVRDVTDRARAESQIQQGRAELEARVAARTVDLERASLALRESEERFRALVENSPDVIMRFDVQSRHLYVSGPVTAMTGIPARDFIGKTHRELGFPEALCEVWETAIRGVFSTGKLDRVEFELPSHVWIDWLLVPERANDGRVSAVMTAARDITAIKHTEEALERRVAERTAELAAANAALHDEIVERRRTEERLRQSLTWQEGVFEGSRDAIFISDAGSRFTAVNRAACELTGYGREELLRMRIPDLHEGMDLHAYQAFHDRILAGEEIVTEAKIRRKDGTKVDTEFNNRLVVVGAESYMHSAARDVSERRRAESALRESEERFRGIFENAMIGFYRTTPDGHIVLANQALVRMLGYAEFAELSARNLEQRSDPLDYTRSEFKERIERDGVIVGLEARWQRRDGSVLHVRESARVIRDSAGKTQFYEGTVEDVTDRKLAEAALGESEERFRRLSDAAFEGIVITDQGRIVDVNTRLAEILRCRPADLIGRSALDFVVPEDHELVLQHFRSGSEDAYEHSMLRADGARFPAEVRGRPLPYGGKTVRVTAIRDISERRQAEEALRESELQFRTLAETTGLGILIVRDEHYTYANPAAERLTGYTAKELARMRFWDLVHPEFREIVRRRGAARMAGERDLPGRYEVKAIVKDGSERWFSLTSGATMLGGSPALVASITDVTDERRLREVQSALYEISEATQSTGSLDELFHSIHAIIGRLMDARNFYIALYDPVSNLISFPYFVDEVDVTPDPFPFGQGMTSYVLRTAKPLFATAEIRRQLEAQGVLRAGGAPSLDWMGVPLKAQDRAIGVLVVQSYHDDVRFGDTDKEILTYVSSQVAQAIERKRAEEELRESEQTARALINSPNYDAVLVDSHGRVLAANRRVCESLGTTQDGILGNDLFSLFEPEVGVRRQAQLELVVRTGQAVRFEDQRKGRSFDSTFYPILDAGGGVARVAIVALDITDAKRTEAALRESQKMHAIGQLAGGVAHDFNNLLQALLGSVEMLRARAADPGAFTRALAEVEADVKRGAALTRQLLLFARREVVQVQRLDVNEVVRGTGALLQRLLRENIHFVLDLADEPLAVEADRSQIEQVLVNLAVNAADAMPDGGRLRISTGRVGEAEVFLEMEDTGTGMTTDVQAHIFEPFFTTKGKEKGIGLGLSVVHGIVTQHGGRVEVSSRPGAGSTFRVVLSRQGSGPHPPVVEVLPAAPQGRSIRGERILVVEDEPGARHVIGEILQLLGYEVAMVESGEEALALPPDAKFDLLLTDLLLPGVHGVELAARLREQWPALKVILMSGYAEDESLRRHVADHTVHFLQKPFGMEALSRELLSALAEP